MDFFQEEISNIKINKNRNVFSLHKPLLLLLAISKVINGHKNEFHFVQIESELRSLLLRYGLKNTKEIKAHYPFVYLAGESKIWSCSVERMGLKNPDSATRGELIGAVGKFTDEFYEYLSTNNQSELIVHQILRQFWPFAYHSHILNELNLQKSILNNYKLNKQNNLDFRETVLDNYERKCAICFQSIRLADILIGIEACHVRPLEHSGVNDVSNGIALCTIHQNALVWGAISITTDMELIISKKLNGNKLHDFITSFEKSKVFSPRDKNAVLSTENILYHQNYIFAK